MTIKDMLEKRGRLVTIWTRGGTPFEGKVTAYTRSQVTLSCVDPECGLSCLVAVSLIEVAAVACDVEVPDGEAAAE